MSDNDNNVIAFPHPISTAGKIQELADRLLAHACFIEGTAEECGALEPENLALIMKAYAETTLEFAGRLQELTRELDMGLKKDQRQRTEKDFNASIELIQLRKKLTEL